MLPVDMGDPKDRESYAVYIRDIELDHKPGGDGNMIAFEKVILRKRGSPNWEQEVDAKRLERDDPRLYRHLLPIIDEWRRTNKITTDGHPVDAWPARSKGEIKNLKSLGLLSVEDVAAATDNARERYGMGFLDIQKQAKAFLEAKAKTTTAKKITDLERALESMQEQLKEALETNRALAAKAGLVEKKPEMRPREAA